MAYTSQVHINAQTLNLLGTPAAPAAVPAAGTTVTTAITRLQGMKALEVQMNFTYGSGGTSVDIYVQTSLDQGLTWVDVMDMQALLVTVRKVGAVNTYIAAAAPAAATDGSLAANTINNGILGDRIRVKMTVVGTYAASTIAVTAIAKG